MKRKRKSIKVNFLPTGSYGQVVYLECIDFSPYVTLALGPYFYDASNGKIVPLREATIPGDAISERVSEVAPAEGVVYHIKAEGELVQTPGTVSQYETVKQTIPGTEMTSTVSGQCLHSCDELGNPYSYVTMYEKGSGIVVGTRNPFFVNGFEQRDTDGDFLTSHIVWAHGKYLCHRWERRLEGDVLTGMESLSISLPSSDIVIQADNLVHMPGRMEELRPDGSIYIEDIDVKFYVIYVSPPALTMYDDGETLQAWLGSLRNRSFETLSILAGLTPEDGLFLATRKAVDGLKVCGVNGIAFVKELFAFSEMVPPILRILRKPFSPKSWAGLLLWWKYGVTLSLADAKALIAAFKSIRKMAHTLQEYRMFKNSIHTTYGTVRLPIEYEAFTSCTHRSNARLVSRLEFPIGKTQWDIIGYMMDDMGTRINAEKLWDMLPLSFVIDWFVNISELCSQIDYSATIEQLHVRELVYSSKNVGQTVNNLFYRDFSLFGSVRMETYSRNVSLSLPAPSWRTGAPTFLNHIWDGTLIYLGLGGLK